MSPPRPGANRPERDHRSMTALEWAMLIALAAIWGASFFFNAVAVRELPVLTVVVGRVGLAALILLTAITLTGRRLPAGRPIWGAFFIMGLLNNAIPFSLIVAGQQHLASGIAAILNATTPLFSVLLAPLFLHDERLTRGRLAGTVIGFAGVGLMIGVDAATAQGRPDLPACLMALGAAVSYALAGLFGRRFAALGLPPVVTATGQLIATSLLLLPASLLFDQPWTLPVPGPAALGALIGTAALSTALAYILYFRILATAGATNVVLVTFLIPVSAILLGSLFLGEHLLPRHFAGLAVIGFGLATIDGRLWTALRRPAADIARGGFAGAKHPGRAGLVKPVRTGNAGSAR